VKIAKLLKENATELEDNDFTRWQGADYNCLLIEVLTDIHYDKLQMYWFYIVNTSMPYMTYFGKQM